MGSGKSTQGKKLASILRMGFADLDQYIQKKENKTVQFIFEEEGEKQFRDLETKYLNELIADKNGKVISLGGGTVCFNGNLESIKRSGMLIYIEMNAEDLAARLKRSRQNRPLLKNISPDELVDFISDKLKEREEYYRSAHLTIAGAEINLLQLKEEILIFKRNHAHQ